MGAPEPVIDRARRDWEAQLPEQPLIEVFPENVDAFRVLIACEGQWEFPGAFGGRLALPLTEVRAAIEMLQVADPKDCFSRMLVLIKYAAAALRERMPKPGKR